MPSDRRSAFGSGLPGWSTVISRFYDQLISNLRDICGVPLSCKGTDPQCVSSSRSWSPGGRRGGIPGPFLEFCMCQLLSTFLFFGLGFCCCLGLIVPSVETAAPHVFGCLKSHSS